MTVSGLDRVFLDTSFVQALFSRRDEHPNRAIALRSSLEAATIWTTEAVLFEIGNALATLNREAAVEFIEDAYRAPNIQVVRLTTEGFLSALALYRSRPDKQWGLVDCLSFEAMRREQISAALTADRHFVQAGFRALMLEEL